MVNFNLFPQQKFINRGWRVNTNNFLIHCGLFWKQGVEALIRSFLQSVPDNRNPRVYFQVRLHYGDNQFPNRPISFSYLIKFKTDEDDSDNDNEHEEENIRQISRILEGVVLNSIGEEVLESTQELAAWWESSDCSTESFEMACVNVLEKLITAPNLIEDVPAGPEPTPARPSSPLVSRDFSWWDVVPVVGGVRDVMRGVDDFNEGRVASGIFNSVMGVGSLALDVVSLGAVSSVAKTATKEAVKQTGKEATKQAGKVVVKEGVEAVGRTIVKEVVKETVHVAERMVIRQVLYHADAFIARSAGILVR